MTDNVDITEDNNDKEQMQATLREVQSLLARGRRVEGLVHRQDMPRHDLVENLVHKQNLGALDKAHLHGLSADIARVLEALPPDDSADRSGNWSRPIPWRRHPRRTFRSGARPH
jgi:hypothetical protein